MARVRKRGKTYSYEIKRAGKVVAHDSGFKTKREADKVAKEIEVQLDSKLDYRLQPEMSLVELFQSWLDVEIFSQNIQSQTKKKYEKRKRKIEEFLEI
ncbi:Arm DNA-binding domain-containing protein [Streptococcus didelphis]|uniref:Arm DNA-binding domain-containing protein n=1 Tax=Streptococcus didelphis TaxID=102886 RepID=A0ABY9LG36_9STRE|nr:Arm DNA-binding domain-containing protein [Streptococcus didelphis]